METTMKPRSMVFQPITIDSVKECGSIPFRDIRWEPYIPLSDCSFDAPPSGPACSGLETLLGPDGSAVINSDATILFDLGRVIKGSFEVVAKLPAGTKVTLACGEALEPLRTYPMTPEPDGTWQTFQPAIPEQRDVSYTGLRFVWLRVENLTEPGYLRAARGVLRIYPCESIGAFSCSDDMLTRIWDLSAWSARLCMEAEYASNPDKPPFGVPHSVVTALILDRVDRFPWIGDARIIHTALTNAFGEFAFVKNSLDFFVPKAVPYEGGIPATSIAVKDLPPYLLDWCLAVLDYFEYTGDRAELEDRIPVILGILKDWIQSYMVPGGFYFIDWDKRVMAHHGHEREEPIFYEAYPAFICKYIETARRTAEICESQGLTEAAKTAGELADRRAADWLNLAPDWPERFNIHALTNALLAGLGSEDQRETVYRRVYADPEFRCTGTPYFGFHVLRALALLGRHEDALDMLRRYWGKMIDLGATTVWEEFEREWDLKPNQQPPQPFGYGCNSLCQPAGSGPVRWLHQEILGVKPAAPGFAKILIEPHPTTLAWAKGSVPTPSGVVKVAWQNQKDEFQIDIHLPKGTTARVILPPEAQKIWQQKPASRPWESRIECERSVAIKATPANLVVKSVSLKAINPA
jgi:alpha-L-rhamnosidase